MNDKKECWGFATEFKKEALEVYIREVLHNIYKMRGGKVDGEERRNKARKFSMPPL